MSAKVSLNSSNSLQKGNITPGSDTYLVKSDGVSLEHLKPFKHCWVSLDGEAFLYYCFCDTKWNWAMQVKYNQ